MSEACSIRPTVMRLHLQDVIENCPTNPGRIVTILHTVLVASMQAQQPREWARWER